MRVLGLILLVVFAPVILPVMLIVRLTSPGPALFRQMRVGRDGKEFMVLKARTMYRNAERILGPVLCQPGDSRITPVGRVLRFLHVDELPQLINVVRGEMCLVGPRPERPEIIDCNQLDQRVPGFIDRTKVMPGITGLAQINLPADQTVDCVVPKVRLDLEYIATASAGLDLRILLCTAMRMLGVRHGRAVRLFGLQRNASAAEDRPKKGIRRVSNQFLKVFYNGVNTPSNGSDATPIAHASANGALASSDAPNETSTFGAVSGDFVADEEFVVDSESDPLPRQPR